MSTVEQVDERTLRAVDGDRLLAVAKRVQGPGDRWAVVFTDDGGHAFLDGELFVRAFLADLDSARSDQPNGQSNGAGR